MGSLRVCVVFFACVIFYIKECRAIYDPSKDVPKPSYTEGIKTRFKPQHVQYHQNYSKVLVHNNKNLTFTQAKYDNKNATKLLPVYNKNKQTIGKEVIELNSLISHDRVSSKNFDTIIGRDTVNDRVVYKRRIEKNKQIEVYHKCPSAQTGQFVYDLSCNQFLNCWNGRGGPENCAPGTLFNPKTLECDFPEKVECITGPRESTILTTQSASLRLEQAACPEGFSGLIPNYTDCSKFIRCNEGQQNSLDCPPGTLFDFAQNVCDFPEKSTCFKAQSDNYLSGKEHQNQNVQFHGQPSAIGCDLSTGKCFGQYQASPGPQNLSYGHGTSYNVQGSNCDPLNANCGHAGSVSSGNTQNAGSASFGHETSQGCDPQGSNCEPGQPSQVSGTSYQFQTSSYPQNNVQTPCNPQTRNCATNQMPQSNTAYICDPLTQKCGYVVVTQTGQYPLPAYGFSQSQPCDSKVQDCASTFQGHSTGQNTFGSGVQVSTSTYNQPGCNPQIQNCGSTVQSGQNTYGSNSQPSYGYVQVGIQTPCDPKIQICGNTAQGHLAGQNSLGSGVQGSTNTYSQPGCDPQFQNCAPTIQSGQNSYGSNSQPSYGYGQVGIQSRCDPQIQNCGNTVQSPSTDENTFGSGVQGSTNTYSQPGCDPQVQNCAPTIQSGQNSYGSNSQPSYGYGQVGIQSRCDPQIQNCGTTIQNTHGTTYGQSTQGNIRPNTNYNTVCNMNDKNCQQSQSSTPKCPQDFQGITKHPTNCKKFLNCANGITYVQDCAPGTLFNPLNNICDFPYNVDCKDAVEEVQNVDESTTDDYGYESYGQYTSQKPSGFATVKPLSHDQFYVGNNHLSGEFAQSREPIVQNQLTNVQNEHVDFDGFRNQQTTPAIVDITPRPIYQVERYDENGRVINSVALQRGESDYVDVFDPNTNENVFSASSTARSVWPPPFPTTDLNADYIFEYDDGEEVTLAPENEDFEDYKPKKCEKDDFYCNSNECVPKEAVCNGFKNCKSGKDEIMCEEYVDKFLLYRDSRLEVLEKQMWNNVTLETCAYLCSENKKFICKSFNYRKKDGACFLTDTNIGLSGALKLYYPCDYFELKSATLDCSDMHKCPNHKCLTSEQVCDGYDDCGDRADEKGCIASDFGYKIKLAGSNEKHQGRIEVTAFGQTGYICDDQFNMVDANVVCRELGFELGTLEVKSNSFFARDIEENNTLYMMDDIECVGNESTLLDCTFAGWGIHNCRDQEIAGVICKTPQEKCGEDYWKCRTQNECIPNHFICDNIFDCTDNSDESNEVCQAPIEIKLVNGTTNREGRVEIKYHGTWGTICDDDFNEDAAKVICKHLGFGSVKAKVRKEGYFGKGHGPIWLDQVFCSGNESKIEDCTHWNWGEHNCDQSEDVGIVCNYLVVDYDERHSKDVEVPPEEESMACGYRNDDIFAENDEIHFRVVRGSKAKKGEYPWQAALRVKGLEKSAHWCGAVVISSKWVMTAAHCLVGYSKGAYIVVAGEYDTDEDEGTEQHSYIEEYYAHEQFRHGGNKMNNDIALIRLKGSGFKLNKHIRPLCLPDRDTDYNLEINCTISGFGSVKHGTSAYSHTLMSAWIPVQKEETCKMPHVYGDMMTQGMICAGFLDGGVDACDGDSGGPLACLHDGLFTLYGITSWGHHCGYANKPGVYVKVAHYRDWIDKIIREHSF